MKRTLAILCTLFLAIPLAAQQVALPTEVKGEPGRFIIVEAKTDCLHLQWFCCDDGIQVFPPHLLKSSLTAVVVAQRPGRYRLYAFGAKGDVPTPPVSTVLVVGATPPPGPGPDPGPSPTPVDPLTRTFQSAYDNDVDPKKREHLPVLTALLAEVPNQLTGVLTTEHLAKAVKMATDSQIGTDSLKSVRTEVGKYLGGVLPRTSQELDDALRAKIAAEYTRVAAGLKGVKP